MMLGMRSVRRGRHGDGHGVLAMDILKKRSGTTEVEPLGAANLCMTI